MFDPKSIAKSIVDAEDMPGMAEESPESGMGDEELAAEDVLAAFAENDPKALAAALKSFFQVVDAKPHVEGEHEGED